jgi:hypothetical protein
MLKKESYDSWSGLLLFLLLLLWCSIIILLAE